MFRIAHISDLHIKHESIDNENLSVLQRVAEAIGKSIGLEVEAGGHSDGKLEALTTSLAALKPNLIAVTGDITNFGDRQSFEKAYDFLRQLKERTRAEFVVCVPGNHDCLFERARDSLTNKNSSLLLRGLSKVSREVSVLVSADREALPDDTVKQLNEADGLTLLQNYDEWIIKKGFGEVDPGKPVICDARWGKVALFLFNSTNDPGLMANKGRIGAKQFNSLNKCLQSAENQDCFNAVRFALLHHHPISAPQSLDKDVNRLYDWMEDGPLFLQYLNKLGFHFILHGHQHVPFLCTVDYVSEAERGVHLIAAGSASQGNHSPHYNSFNLIDLVTPFQARMRRFRYSETGFDPTPEIDTVLPVRPLEEVRVTDMDQDETVEDWAIREMIKGSYRKAYDIDAEHQYSLLEFRAAITGDQLYMAEYRRRGKVVSEANSAGPIYVITGSPAMNTGIMNIGAVNNLDGKALAYNILVDHPNQKVIRVLPQLELKPGDEFDLTLKFRWQATMSEPHDFDGFNLMLFRHPVAHLKYSINLAWKPAQAKVVAYGLNNSAPELENVVLEQIENPMMREDFGPPHKFSFEIPNPKPVAYLVSFRPHRS